MNHSLIGKSAPFFSATAVVEGGLHKEISLNDFLGKYVVFFFYPLDFTFVCPTELHAFAEEEPSFAKKEAQVIGCSVDSVYAHSAWLNTPKSKGGIQGITYPLISDITKSIARDYGVLKESEGIAYRALFILDKKGVVRHMLVNDLPIGRSVSEALRVLDALIAFEEHGEVCPANWTKGDQMMNPTAEGVLNYFSAK